MRKYLPLCRQLLGKLRPVTSPVLGNGVCLSGHTVAKRQLRVVATSGTLEEELQLMNSSVAFQNIDKRGATQRFYRQVFIEDYVDDCGQTTGHCLYLDHRLLVVNGHRLVVDSEHLALLMANEFESQGEFIRVDSMPISEFVVSYIEKFHESDVPRDLLRAGFRSTIVEHLQSDLLRIAESPQLKEKGFYEENWRPLVSWFNATFSSDIDIEYLLMRGEEDEDCVIERSIKPNVIAQMDAEDMLESYKQTEMAQRLEHLIDGREARSGRAQFGCLKRWLNEVDDVRLWLLDDAVQYCYSPIVALALVLNAAPVSALLAAVRCPELDTHMIWEDEEALKMNQSMLKLASARCFLNALDCVQPMAAGHAVVRTYDKPVICTKPLLSPKTK